MRTIKFYGESDDLIEVEGDIPRCDEYGQFGDKLKSPFVIRSEQGNAKVYPIYDGCWMFAVGHFDEDIPLPFYAIITGKQHEFSMYVELTMPDDAVVEWEGEI